MKLAVINFSMIYFVAVPIVSKTQGNITGGTFDTALVPVLTSDLFGRFFTEEFWELITVETNRYASKQRQQYLHVSPRAWHDVSVPEMKSFIGILILMGICKMPRLRLYWTTGIELSIGMLGPGSPPVKGNTKALLSSFFHGPSNSLFTVGPVAGIIGRLPILDEVYLPLPCPLIPLRLKPCL